MKNRHLGWKEKLQPAVLEIAAAWREATKQVAAMDADRARKLQELGPNPDPELVRKLAADRDKAANAVRERFEAELVEIDARYQPVPEAPWVYPWLQLSRHLPPGEERDSVGLIEWFHYERHGEPLNATLKYANGGNFDALQRMHRTEEDLFRIAHDQGWIKQFQGDPHHRDLLQILLCFGGEKLSSEELADCFEVYCPCGREHDADALKKQRARLVRELRNASG